MSVPFSRVFATVLSLQVSLVASVCVATTMASNGDTSSAAAASQDDDALVAQKLLATDQLVSIFGFEKEAANKAVEAVGVDVTTCYNYILDAGWGADKGGPVTPLETCPHVQDHVKLTVEQLPLRPHESPCTHHETAGTSSSTAAGVAHLKSDIEEDGSCPPGENWLCLECGVIRCSRYVNGHGLAHWEETKSQDDAAGVGHCVAASLADLSVWCHICRAYLRDPSLLPLTNMLEHLKFDEDGPDRKKARSNSNSREPSEDEDEVDFYAPAADNSRASEGDDVDSQGHAPATDDDEHSASTDEDDEEVDKEEEALLYEVIAATAAARGIPLEFIVDHVEREDEEVEYPFDSLPSSLADISKFILSEKCQSVLILAGAGMSVASGIPDFRSADGLYATLNPDLLTADAIEREAIRSDPTFALDQTLFEKNPLPCLELNREFILGTREQRWKATLAHRFVELLHSKTGKLARLYTQNIDGVEDQCTELPREKVVAVHGSMDRAECAMCKTESDFGEFAGKVQRQIKDLSGRDPVGPASSTPITCELCGAQSMKPAIVLFKSSLPAEFFEKVPEDIEAVDLLIVIGTSLRVAPANSLVWRVPKSAMRLLVNREEVGWHLGMNFGENSNRDYFAEGSCENVLLELMEHLGWLEDLAPLIPGDKLPESSADLLRERLANADSSAGNGSE